MLTDANNDIKSVLKMYHLWYSDKHYILIIFWSLSFHVIWNIYLFSFPPWCYQSRHVTLVWRKVESFELYNSRDNAKEFDDNQRNFQFCFNGLQKDRPIDFHTRKVYKSYYINIIIKQKRRLVIHVWFASWHWLTLFLIALVV